jgi:hypothetical protein
MVTHWHPRRDWRRQSRHRQSTVPLDLYPLVLMSNGGRGRPHRSEPLPNGSWRVEWIGGLASHYWRDPRAHLKLGYEPGHLRVFGADDGTRVPAIPRDDRTNRITA